MNTIYIDLRHHKALSDQISALYIPYIIPIRKETINELKRIISNNDFTTSLISTSGMYLSITSDTAGDSIMITHFNLNEHPLSKYQVIISIKFHKAPYEYFKHSNLWYDIFSILKR